jgi:hypothetical protein
MLEEKAQDLMINMRGLLPLIVSNALNVLGAILILLIGTGSSLGLHRHSQETRRPYQQGGDQQNEGVNVLVIARQIPGAQAFDDPDQKATQNRPRHIAETAL